MLCPGRSSLEIMAGEQQPLLMEATLDGLLSELGSLYASLSGEVARAEIANQDLHANNQQLRSISSRAEDVAAGGDKDGNAQQPNANKLKGGKGKEASTVAEVPSRDSLGKVLAQARAARESGTPKGTQSGHTQSGERKFRAQGQVRNDATIPASRPHKETLSQIARGATRMAAASREAVYKAATPSLSARQQPTSESTSLEEPKVRVTPSAPCLPKRLKVAVQRVKLVRQKRLGMDANNEEAGAHAGARGNRGFYTDQVRTAGRDFVERLSASRVKSTHHQTTARGLRDVWLAHTSQRWIRLLAICEGQALLTDAIQSMVDQPRDDPSQPSKQKAKWHSDDMHELWAEIRAEQLLLSQENPRHLQDMVTWRDQALQSLLPCAPPLSVGNSVARPLPPLGIWLPARMWAAGTQAGSGITQSGPEEAWKSQLFPGRNPNLACGTVYSTRRELDSVVKARHQLQLALLQVHIEGGVASALLAFDRTGSLEHTLDRAQRSRLAAHIRLADTFLCRGMDHGMCTLAERLHEDA